MSRARSAARGAALLGALLMDTQALAHEGYALQIGALNAQLDASPADPALLLSRAQLQRHEGSFELAALDLANAILEASDRSSLYLERARLWNDLGDTDRMAEDLDTYFELGGQAPAVWVLKARVDIAREDFEGARQAFDRAFQASPDVETVLARGALDESRNDFQAAIAGYEEGLDALGGADVVRGALVRACLLGRDFARAETRLTRAIEANPQRTELLLDRADVRAAAGQPIEARDDRERALRDIDRDLAQRPTDLRRLLKARALAALGRTSESRALESAVSQTSPGLLRASR